MRKSDFVVFNNKDTDQHHFSLNSRVKSGNFGHQVNSDSDLVCFIY